MQVKIKEFLIRTKEKQLYALVFMKRDYKGINDALATLRLNLALVEKEKKVQIYGRN